MCYTGILDNFPEECKWEVPMQERALPGLNKKTLSAKTVDECKKECEEEETFNCVSFDYNRASRFCYLQMNNRYDAAVGVSRGYDYYERNCHGKYAALVNEIK